MKAFYKVTTKGQLPVDIGDKMAAAQAEAIKSRKRKRP